MKFKVDESVADAAVEVLRAAGHEACTVREQGMAGATDEALARACCEEGRAFLTLDLGFGDIRAFLPANDAGIIVLRLGDPASSKVRAVVARVAESLPFYPLAGGLWTVDESSIRIRHAAERHRLMFVQEEALEYHAQSAADAEDATRA